MSRSKSLATIRAGWDGYDMPSDGSLFRHYKGGSYEIVATGFLEETETPCVIYRSLEKDIVWVRSAKNFFKQIEHDGQQRPRFEKL